MKFLIVNFSINSREKINIMESSISNYFPKSPAFNQNGHEVKLATSFFSINYKNSESKSFFKYAIIFEEPELPEDATRLRIKIWRKAKEQIEAILGHTFFNNTTCYSQINYPDKIEVITEPIDGQVYRISIMWTNLVNKNDLEALPLYKRFLGTLVRRMNFNPIRRSFFEPSKAITVDNVEVWPGFNSTINLFSNGVMLNMNITYKVFRQDTALSVINKIRQNQQNAGEFMSEVQELFRNTVVLARYSNDKTYIIDSVDFNVSPTSFFTSSKKGETKTISYVEYYQQKYGKNIQVLDQPMLVSLSRKRGAAKTDEPEKIYLVPELCFMTGLTDEMRANFQLMKQMAVITKGDANQKMKECTNIISLFNQNEKCRQDIETWGLTISNTPISLKGRKLDAGAVLMHKRDPQNNNNRHSFQLEGADDIDRKIQAEMYSQPPLSKWAVFSTMRDKETTENVFLKTLQQVQESFKYNMGEPRRVYVKSQNLRDWEEQIRNTIGNNQDVTAVVLIIPGSKGKGQLYNDIKRIFCVDYQIPSQVVLTSTLNKRKKKLICSKGSEIRDKQTFNANMCKDRWGTMGNRQYAVHKAANYDSRSRCI